MEKLRRELEAAVEALEQGRQELSSFAEQVLTLINTSMVKITRMMKVLTKKRRWCESLLSRWSSFNGEETRRIQG